MTSPAISTITPLDDAGLSEKEIKLLASAWLASSSTNLDIDKFATIAGYVSPVNARKRFGEAKNRARAKIFGSGTSTSGPGSAGVKTDGVEYPLTPKIPKLNPKRKSPTSNRAKTTSEGSSPKRKRKRTLKREEDEVAPSVAKADTE